MEKRTKKKIGSYAIALGLLGGIVASTTPAFAGAETDIDFKYTIKANQANTRTAEPRYRQTSNENNKWMVQVTNSTENGGRTWTTFWLEGSNGENVSPSQKVLEDDGRYNQKAYSTASKRTVYLTAQNNNNNDDVFTVNGYWDEEGW